MEKLTSRENKNIKEFVKLGSSKSFRDQTGLFALESIKLVLEAFCSGISIEKVFVTQCCLDKNGVALQKLFDACSSIYLISDEIEHKLTQTNNAQGIFAIGKKLDKQLDADKIKNSGKLIYLSDLQDTGNVGTIIRTAEALGLDGVIISRNTCDVYSIKVLRASMGSVFRMPVYHSNDTVADLTSYRNRFTTYAAVVDGQALSLEDVRFSENSILVIGNEGNGLDQAVVCACSQQVTIRMKGRTESFNAAMAAGILMWEMQKD